MKRFATIAIASLFVTATAAVAGPAERNPHSRGTTDRGVEHLNPRALEVRAGGTNPLARAIPAVPATPATPGTPAKPATPAVPPTPRGKPPG